MFQRLAGALHQSDQKTYSNGDGDKLFFRMLKKAVATILII